MEKRKVTNILLIITLVVVLCLCCFTVYDKILKKEESSVCENGVLQCNCPICEDNQNETIVNNSNIVKTYYDNMAKNRKTMVEYDYNIIVVVDKNGNAYYGINKYGNGTVKNGVGTKGNYTIDGYYEAPEDGVLNGYKLPISDVVNFYYGARGNGGNREYIFIKADGTIAKLEYYGGSNGVEIISFEETVSGYNNIIGIIPANGFGAHGYKLFDIYGNIYN